MITSMASSGNAPASHAPEGQSIAENYAITTRGLKLWYGNFQALLGVDVNIK